MDDDAKLRSARRFIWLFRAIFYPGAALLAVLMLTQRDGHAKPSPTLSGVTSQSMRFTALIEAGRISQFRTLVKAECPSGRAQTQVWSRVDGNPKFVWDGRRLVVRDPRELPGGGTGLATLDATLGADAVLEGTMTFELIGLEACRSGTIRFTASLDR